MENIKPAIPSDSKKCVKDLSCHEFQQTLNAWLQEKGVIRDMKSYLKFQMINVLKNTPLGQDIKKNMDVPHTLAQQALHLIVAEYLLHYKCHFSLSLFSTEMELSHVLPGVKPFTDSGPTYKFNRENVVNIMELVGMPNESSTCGNILQEYYNNSQPLLECLLNIMGTKPGKPVEDNDCSLTDLADLQDDFLQNIAVTLKSSNLPYSIYKQLLCNLKICYKLKTKSYENQFSNLLNKFKKELDVYEQKLEHSRRKRKCLERKIDKLQEENDRLKISEQIVSTCNLNHCTEECTSAKNLCKCYETELELLKRENAKYKEDIKKLQSNYSLLQEKLNDCQSKINLANIKILDKATGPNESDTEDTSSSDFITEDIDILQEAKQKLKLLEIESEELDMRFNKYLIH